jgi:hypothetical protein
MLLPSDGVLCPYFCHASQYFTKGDQETSPQLCLASDTRFLPGVSLILAPALVSHALSDLRVAHHLLTQPRTPDASALHLSEILQPQGGGSTGGRRGTGGGKRRKATGETSTGGPLPAGSEAQEAFQVAGGALRALEKLLAVVRALSSALLSPLL